MAPTYFQPAQTHGVDYNRMLMILRCWRKELGSGQQQRRICKCSRQDKDSGACGGSGDSAGRGVEFVDRGVDSDISRLANRAVRRGEVGDAGRQTAPRAEG